MILYYVEKIALVLYLLIFEENFRKCNILNNPLEKFIIFSFSYIYITNINITYIK